MRGFLYLYLPFSLCRTNYIIVIKNINGINGINYLYYVLHLHILFSSFKITVQLIVSLFYRVTVEITQKSCRIGKTKT